MKRTLVGIMLAGLYATASAQGYVGAIVGLSNYDLDCGGNASPCDEKGNGFKFYAGTQFKQGLVNTERFKIDTLEVSYIRFGGSKRGTGTRTDTRVDPDTGDTIVTNRATDAGIDASALTVAGVGRFLITPAFTASAKLGVAYVRATVDQHLGGTSWGSDTKGKYRPYVGFGLEYAVSPQIKVVGSFDTVEYEGRINGRIDGKNDGEAGNVVNNSTVSGDVYQLGLGVQLSF